MIPQDSPAKTQRHAHGAPGRKGQADAPGKNRALKPEVHIRPKRPVRHTPFTDMGKPLQGRPRRGVCQRSSGRIGTRRREAEHKLLHPNAGYKTAEDSISIFEQDLQLMPVGEIPLRGFCPPLCVLIPVPNCPPPEAKGHKPHISRQPEGAGRVVRVQPQGQAGDDDKDRQNDPRHRQRSHVNSVLSSSFSCSCISMTIWSLSTALSISTFS